MCKHELSYLLKEHEGNVYAGIMLELQGLVIHGSSQKDVEAKLIKQSVLYFNTFKEVHEQALNHTLQPKLHASTMGIPKAINTITVECPPNAN